MAHWWIDINYKIITIAVDQKSYNLNPVCAVADSPVQSCYLKLSMHSFVCALFNYAASQLGFKVR